VVVWNQISICNDFQDIQCDALVDMTLNDLQTKVKVIHFGTNRFLIYDFLYAVNSNFCSRMHHSATIQNVTVCCVCQIDATL